MEKKTYFEILQEVESEELRHKILHNTLQEENRKEILKAKFFGVLELINSSFLWSSSKEGRNFWVDVAKNYGSEVVDDQKLSVIDLLKEVKDSKLQYEIYENIVSQRSLRFDKLSYLNIPAMISEGFTWSKTKQGHSYWKEVYESFPPPERDDTGVSPEEQKSIISLLEILSKF